MNTPQSFTPEELSAFLDGRLEAPRSQELLDAAERDGALFDQLQQGKLIDRTVRDLYQHVRIPDAPSSIEPRVPGVTLAIAAMFTFALVAGGWLGWALNHKGPSTSPKFQSLAEFDVGTSDTHKILLHISTADPDRVGAALDTAERILARSQAHGEPTQLEIVANAAGLAVLRVGSPFAERIQQLTDKYDSLSFKACGIAMHTAQLEEGHVVRLLPEAERVDAALEEILLRLRQGWTYIRA